MHNKTTTIAALASAALFALTGCAQSEPAETTTAEPTTATVSTSSPTTAPPTTKARATATEPASASTTAQPPRPAGRTVPAKRASLNGCEAFAHYVKHSPNGTAGMDRRTTVDQVAHEFQQADKPVDSVLADNLGTLTDTVEGPDSAWIMAADSFANACFDLGWRGN